MIHCEKLNDDSGRRAVAHAAVRVFSFIVAYKKKLSHMGKFCRKKPILAAKIFTFPIVSSSLHSPTFSSKQTKTL